MMWIKYNIEDRKEYLPSLLENVRLPLLTPQYLTDVIDNEVNVNIKPDSSLLTDV